MVEMYSARVRGIYTTALTKMLLDEGFRIVQPSKEIEQRFGLSYVADSPDLDIWDREDRQGVEAVGAPGAVDVFCQMLFRKLDDVVVIKREAPVGAIAKGVVCELESDGSAIIDLGFAKGKLREGASDLSLGNEVVVQLELASDKLGRPVLTKRISVPGRYAVLVKGARGGVSRRIRSLDEKARLIATSLSIGLNGWGIVWRTAAAHQPEEVLREEVAKLAEEAQRLEEECEKASAPSVVRDGLRYVKTEFPPLSKSALDDVRAEVVATVRGHHRLKSWGGEHASYVEMAEALLSRGEPVEDVLFHLRELELSSFPDEGDSVSISHAKLSGRVLSLGVAEVVESDEELGWLKLKRVFKKPGVYDGLGVEKLSGDYAITCLRIGTPFLVTSYFSQDSAYKGSYANISTPIELLPGQVRYVDLEVDVVVVPSRGAEIIDEEGLREACAKGFFGKKLYEQSLELAKEIRDAFAKDPNRSDWADLVLDERWRVWRP